MKKFRLFAMLAVLATLSTVFAAWNFITYADTYTTEPIKITVGTLSTQINEGDAITITATAPAGLSVFYPEEITDSYAAKAEANGSVNVKVTETIEGAADEYTYSYKVYANSDALKDYSKLTTETDAEATTITLDENGVATISGEDIAKVFDIDFGKQPTKDDLDLMNARIEGFSRVNITVYATKK